MESIVVPINRWNKQSIRPGPVGSVGDVNIQVELRKSTPAMKARFDPKWSKANAKWSGSNVQDGSKRGFTSLGGAARVKALRWRNRRSFKTDVGWIKEDIVPLDRKRETKMGSTGDLGWNIQVANIFKARTTGDSFLPSPGEFKKEASGIHRGGLKPRVIATAGSSLPNAPVTDLRVKDPQVVDRLDDTSFLAGPGTTSAPNSGLGNIIGRAIAAVKQGPLGSRRHRTS